IAAPSINSTRLQPQRSLPHVAKQDVLLRGPHACRLRLAFRHESSVRLHAGVTFPKICVLAPHTACRDHTRACPRAAAKPTVLSLLRVAHSPTARSNIHARLISSHPLPSAH